MSAMLRDFMITNREQIIDRARRRGRERAAGKLSEAKLERGIPFFVTQLAEELVQAAPTSALHLVGTTGASYSTSSAVLRGRDLLRNYFTVAQVVHGYANVCQVVTEILF